MLGLLRKHQKKIFLMISIVVIISFSFWGPGTKTATRMIQPTHSVECFYTYKGDKIDAHLVDKMGALLLDSEQDKNPFVGKTREIPLITANILKDLFLETGLAEVLFENSFGVIKDSLSARLEREKHFVPYQHPQLNFISADMVWKFHAPYLKQYLESVQSSKSVDMELFKNKVHLYLEQKKFPASLLKNLLHYQESQYSWVTVDSNLLYQDFSLFGYRNVEDWFGKEFIDETSKFIFNAASFARDKGYNVSKEEARASLLRLNDQIFREAKFSLKLQVAQPADFYQNQLEILGLEEDVLVSLWQEILVFKKMLDDVGGAVFESSLPYRQFFKYASQELSMKLYQLPDEMKFSQFKDAQRFWLYLKSVAAPFQGLDKMPETYLSIEDVQSKAPSLVKTNYLLRVAEVKKAQMEAKVGVKQTWEWELEESNWNRLIVDFPSLASQATATREERQGLRSSLTDDERRRLDAKARSMIVDENRNWLNEALEQAPYRDVVVGVRDQGGQLPFVGLSEEGHFRSLLKEAPVASSELDLEKIHAELKNYSEDGKHFYRVIVLKKDDVPQIVSFKDAVSEGTLDQMLEQYLRSHYEKLVQEKSSLIKIVGDKPIPFEEMVYEIGYDAFKQELTSSYLYLKEVVKDDKIEHLSPMLQADYIASQIFYCVVANARSSLLAEGKFSDYKKEGLSSQWEIKEVSKTLKRTEKAPQYLEVAFSLPSGTTSEILRPISGDLSFFVVESWNQPEMSLDKYVDDGKLVLSRQVEKNLVRIILDEINTANN